MTDHQDQQPPAIPTVPPAFNPLSPEQLQQRRQQRDQALAAHRPLIYDDANDPPPIFEVDLDRPMQPGTAKALMPYSEDAANPNPQSAAIAYQKLVEHTFKLAFTEPYLSLEDMEPYRIKAAYRLMRHMARFRGYLEADVPLMELTAEQWMRPEPLRPGSKFNGFLAISPEIRALFDSSGRVTEKFQTPVLSETGQIMSVPGMALMPPPPPMRFRDATSGLVKVLEYDADQDVNLVIYCKMLELVAEELTISEGSKWDKNSGRYGLMGLFDPRTVRWAMPSRTQLISWEIMLVEETLGKIIDESTAQAATDLKEKHGLTRQEARSIMKLAKIEASHRVDSDIEENRSLMILRLEELIRRSKDPLVGDLRVETMALKQLGIIQQLASEQSTNMSDFIRVIATVNNERRQAALPTPQQKALET